MVLAKVCNGRDRIPEVLPSAKVEDYLLSGLVILDDEDEVGQIAWFISVCVCGTVVLGYLLPVFSLNVRFS